jgi:hypothetical protein
MGILSGIINFGLTLVEKRLDNVARITGQASGRIAAGNFPQTADNLTEARN